MDGPKGPRHQVKPGVFEISRLANAYIVPVGAAASPAKTFEKAWNKTYLPWPFAKVSVVFQDPLPPVPKSSSPKTIARARELATHISDANSQARKIIAEG